MQFIGTDRAVILNSGSRGQSVEFLRDSTGRVGWLRLEGRAIVRDRSDETRGAARDRSEHVLRGMTTLAAVGRRGDSLRSYLVRPPAASQR
jgi:hypothetical protein